MHNEILTGGRTCISDVWLYFFVYAWANKQVYAVEFTDMANHARRLVAKNGMEDVVEVIQCSVEDLKLEAKVRARQSTVSIVPFCCVWGTKNPHHRGNFLMS